MNNRKNITNKLFQAIEYRDVTLVEFYIRQGADTEAKNNDNKQAIQVASDKGFYDIVKLIATLQESNNATQYGYNYALLSATFNREAECVLSLLKAGAKSTNFYETSKDTALHTAVKNGDEKTIAILLQYHANEMALNAENKTPKDINPECFKKGWLLNEYSKLISTYSILIVQGSRQPNSIFHRLIDDLPQRILDEISMNFFSEITKKNITHTKENLFKKSVECFVSEYPNVNFFCGITQKQASKDLVANLNKDKNSVVLIKGHLNQFFKEKYSHHDHEETRAITLLKKFHIVDDKYIDQCKTNYSKK